MIKIHLSRKSSSINWIRSTPWELHYSESTQSNVAAKLYDYLFRRRYTINVKEEYLAGKRPRRVSNGMMCRWKYSFRDTDEGAVFDGQRLVVGFQLADDAPESQTEGSRNSSTPSVFPPPTDVAKEPRTSRPSQAETKFVVAFGTNENGHIWVDIITTAPAQYTAQDSLKEIYDSYNKFSRRGDVRARSLDELSAVLGDGIFFEVDIDFSRSISPSAIPRPLPPPIICGLRVVIRLTPTDDNGATVSKSSPNMSLKSTSDDHILTGCLPFNSKKTYGWVDFTSGRGRERPEVIFAILFEVSESSQRLTARFRAYNMKTQSWLTNFEFWFLHPVERTWRFSIQDRGTVTVMERFDVVVEFTKPSSEEQLRSEGPVGKVTDIAIVTVSTCPTRRRLRKAPASKVSKELGPSIGRGESLA
ncbi:hypothetical protein D9758_012393 [Tetrapyrgos nigripes]|uniref:Uncharacterized protein n=1 Tax=Tetrapyrgos nigripes TaxID=182062 RepID=A0A8H5D6G7_9AGAR|nr:hypothetical protein D9758_012393 [Tetrapyrgos nigripes]